MDLHDYRDVAENYDLYLEAMSAGFDAYEGFRDFYLELARKYGAGGVADIACGTGAVLLYLAEKGITDIEGTDLSAEMCRVAAAKAEEKGLCLRIIPSDMRTFDPGRKYSLAIIARSGFLHLPTQQAQIDALRNIRERLYPGGILTFNTFDPWPAVQASQLNTTPDDYSFRLEYVNSRGRREKLYNAITYDLFTQRMYGNWKFVEYDENGKVTEERIRPVMMRQTYRSEVFLLAELCGFEVLDLYRGYKGDREGLSDPSSARRFRSDLVWILRRKE